MNPDDKSHISHEFSNLVNKLCIIKMQAEILSNSKGSTPFIKSGLSGISNLIDEAYEQLFSFILDHYDSDLAICYYDPDKSYREGTD